MNRLVYAKSYLSTINPILIVAVVTWLLLMIAVPIQRWLWGDDALPLGLSLGVIAQVTAVAVIVITAWGMRRAVMTLALVVCMGWFVEYIGSKTGFPFGTYNYTELLQPQLGGVPLLIPLAWLMMMPSSWAVAACIVPDRHSFANKVKFVGVAALAFTAWDLFLDPQMVSWRLWTWENLPALNYFGIPFSNYLGWLLASGLITTVVCIVNRWFEVGRPAGSLLQHDERATRSLSRMDTGLEGMVVPLLIIYAITWLLQTGGLLCFWGLPGPALVGFIGMGIMLLWAVYVRRSDRVR